jgi:WD40 repeat protein
LRGQRSHTFDLDFGSTNDRVLSAGDDGNVRTWDAGPTRVWTIPSLTHNLDFNRDGRLIASSSDDGTVRVYDTATGRLRTSLPGPGGYTSGTFSPTSDTLVVANYEGARVRTWPVSAATAETVMKGIPINDARFDPTGKRIVYVDDNGKLAIRELASGREVTLGGTPKTVLGAEFSPDGRRVAAVPANGDVLVWRVADPTRPERKLEGHEGAINEKAFSPDGRFITAGADRTVRVWNLDTGSSVVMEGHEDEVTTVVATADGSKVLSSSQDGTLRLWDSRTGVQLAALQSGGELYDVGLSRKGEIATLGEGEVVRIFPCIVCGSLDQVRALALSRSPRELTADERRRYLGAAG